MDRHDVRILRGAAIPTAAAGALAMLLSFLLAGGLGALGSLIGLGLVAAFFTVGMVAMAYAARVSAAVLMQVALLTYLVKIVTLGALLFALTGTEAFSLKAFAWTVIACTLVWIAAQVRAFSREPMLYVDPDAGGDRG